MTYHHPGIGLTLILMPPRSIKTIAHDPALRTRLGENAEKLASRIWSAQTYAKDVQRYLGLS